MSAVQKYEQTKFPILMKRACFAVAKPELIMNEIMREIKSVPANRLGEILEFVKVLSRAPVELSLEELEELKKARQEIAEGKFITLEDLEREL
ncbi:hypothetical protein SPSYN_00104 [Sporotomaculum syntrophicum]|uniref:Uncharacterized protein n=1 Tax=Sporotomaculum syntrophicum TaxID=182264 RepID=A0A9D2WSZ8_9FIRM|nr:hypothetical protein SPSYN_00104 [Sporotomaculum syntrophicum]